MNREMKVREKYSRITQKLKHLSKTITTMESATSGMIASLITNGEGASTIFKGAFVTYCNDAKIRNGVPEEIISIMNKYKEVTIKAENSSLLCQDMYAQEMMRLSHFINAYIGMELEKYYRRKSGVSDDKVITVRDALEYELSISNYNYDRITDSLYMVTPREDIKEKKTYL